ncbi:MAG: threonine--tRNA ligase [Gammaproteobacteria bacterium]|nr:threonine--tRNA ligase [Gammaproteobacteria bacterium]MDE0365497.1 threonine--tRNA ligase [Gammaproteobacteria bacterium]
MVPLEHSGGEAPIDEIYRIRHSLAHVLAQAVLEMRPGSTLGFGPPIRDGFYYDFILSDALTEEDFPELERRMKKILKKRQRFYREDLGAEEALARIDEMGEPYKREYGAELIEKHGLDGLSFYRNGPFLDMCEGPHVEDTGRIPRDAFKLRNVAGAYWRGDSDNVMMTRIYAWAFATREELDAHVARWEEAQARDHKKLGRALGIFVIDDDIGRGLPLWLPNGTVVRDELEKLAKELEFRAGYQRVATPHLARESLYRKTGHLPFYADDMYPPMEVPETGDGEAAIREAYRLRPMNCPHHHKIFAAEPRSYRDLPLRLAEYGQVYRWEESGAVSGLLRVRGMSMNDAHIYCTPEQIESEFMLVMAMYREAYEILGLEDYVVRLSRWDPDDPKGKLKYVDNPRAWERSERILTAVLEKMGVDYVDGKGEAAFYGPKIDIQLVTVTGREESLSTVQLDFSQPESLGLVYTGTDGAEHTPYCIHRAPLSTHERLVAFLLEHYAGAFPTWLAPVQAQVIAVSERFDDYGLEVVNRLRERMVRAELASSSETVSKKIRQGTTRKIPNLLIVGERERAERTVTLRRYGHREQHTLGLERFEAALLATIGGRSKEFLLPDRG